MYIKYEIECRRVEGEIDWDTAAGLHTQAHTDEATHTHSGRATHPGTHRHTHGCNKKKTPRLTPRCVRVNGLPVCACVCKCVCVCVCVCV